jgi:hypothetical protein
MLALKLLLVPAFLALLTLAGRLFGPGIAGWLAGLPLVAGPILLVLALENGGAFAAQAATATVSAVLALVSYSLAYAHVAQRAGWPVALAAGFVAWAVVATALAFATPSLGTAVALALATLLVARPFQPRRTAAAHDSRRDADAGGGGGRRAHRRHLERPVRAVSGVGQRAGGFFAPQQRRWLCIDLVAGHVAWPAVAGGLLRHRRLVVAAAASGRGLWCRHRRLPGGAAGDTAPHVVIAWRPHPRSGR